MKNYRVRDGKLTYAELQKHIHLAQQNRRRPDGSCPEHDAIWEDYFWRFSGETVEELDKKYGVEIYNHFSLDGRTRRKD